jgi:hypothetical protein
MVAVGPAIIGLFADRRSTTARLSNRDDFRFALYGVNGMNATLRGQAIFPPNKSTNLSRNSNCLMSQLI